MPRFAVTVARTVDEYAQMMIDAPTAAKAERLALKHLKRDTAPALRWRLSGLPAEDYRTLYAEPATEPDPLDLEPKEIRR